MVTFTTGIAIINTTTKPMNCITNNETIVPQGAAVTSSNNKSKARNHVWVNMKKKFGNDYLFLANDNVRDIHLFVHFSHERPYEKGYGIKEKAWESIAINLSTTKRLINEKLFGVNAVIVKQVKLRFQAVMV